MCLFPLISTQSAWQQVAQCHDAPMPVSASLCSPSRWVIYGWHWAPKAPPSLCRPSSAKLGPRWDINPSQTPWPTRADKQTFPSLLFCFLGSPPSVFSFKLSHGCFPCCTFCFCLSLISISYFLAQAAAQKSGRAALKIKFVKNIKQLSDWIFYDDLKHVCALMLLVDIWVCKKSLKLRLSTRTSNHHGSQYFNLLQGRLRECICICMTFGEKHQWNMSKQYFPTKISLWFQTYLYTLRLVLIKGGNFAHLFYGQVHQWAGNH